MEGRKVGISEEVEITVGNVQLFGFLHVPEQAKGVVLFAHGSGSGRFSPRNQFVAKYLQEENIGTLLFDLLTEEEEKEDMESRQIRFNIPFLAERLMGATDWINSYDRTHELTIGYFGASTGAAAALIAAAERGRNIRAVVSRGGRPDLAGQVLYKVQSPTLLIVGANDTGVVELNQQALDLLHCEKKIEIVPNATHLFEESGALEEVGRMASIWFNKFL